MKFVWGRANAIAKKEVYHVLRDPFTLALSIGLPLFLIFMFGFAIEFNVKNIPLAVYDADKTQISRRLIDTFGSSGYFIIDLVSSPNEAQEAVLRNEDRALLIISGGLQKNLFSNRSAEVQLMLDGSDNSTVGPILSYLNSIQMLASERLTESKIPQPVNLKTRFLFNPELNSRWFVIPGLIVAIMSILSVLLTSLTVSREWENGSMELLLSTPVEPLEIIVGKLIPYAGLGLLSVAFIYIISRTIFDIPFQGNLWVFSSGCILFLITYLAQGLLISVLIRSQQLATQVAMMAGLLPSQLLSGFIFPVESMPDFFRYLTKLIPATWFMNISRQSYLKGSTLIDLQDSFLALGILASILIFFAIKKFKRDLEP